MENLADNLNAIDPQYEGQLSPRQLVAQQRYQRATSPYEFFQAKYTPFQNASIEDNSQLIGKTSLDSQNAAMSMQQSGADAALAPMHRGRIGNYWDKVKDTAKSMVVNQQGGGASHKSEAQIHAGESSQGSGAGTAFADAPAISGAPSSAVVPSSGAIISPKFTDEHLNAPNEKGIRTFTDKGHDYINSLADTYHKANSAVNNPFGIQGKLNNYQDEAESYFK